MKSIKNGIIHGYAQCQDCEWDAAIDIGSKNRMGKLRKEISNHVDKTKHTVTLEKGSSTDYLP